MSKIKITEERVEELASFIEECRSSCRHMYRGVFENALYKTCVVLPKPKLGFIESAMLKLGLIKEPSTFNELHVKESKVLWLTMVCCDPESKDFLQNYNMILDLFYNSPREEVENNAILKKWLQIYDDQVDRLQPFWMQFRFGSSSEERLERDKKFYISVDNKDSHRFANKLIYLAIENKFYDLNFKINVDPNINRRDNVVVYTTTDNYRRNLNLIKKALEITPDITINSPNLLAIPCEDSIFFGIDSDETSFTEKVISEIARRVVNGHDARDIACDIVKYQQRYGGDSVKLEEYIRNQEDEIANMSILVDECC